MRKRKEELDERVEKYIKSMMWDDEPDCSYLEKSIYELYDTLGNLLHAVRKDHPNFKGNPDEIKSEFRSRLIELLHILETEPLETLCEQDEDK